MCTTWPLLAERDVTGEAAGEAGYQAPDPSRDYLSELNRELEDLFVTTAPGPLGMSDQAYADLPGSPGECLRTSGEAFEAEVEGGNHPAPEGGSTPGTAEPKPPRTPDDAAQDASGRGAAHGAEGPHPRASLREPP